MKNCRCFLSVFLIAIFGVAHSDVYKYEDVDGNVIFTDEPPANDAREIVDLPSFDPPSKPTPVGVIRRAEQRSLIADQVERRRINNVLVEQFSEHDRWCTEARVALEVLHQGMPVYWIRDGVYRAAWSGDSYDGPRVYLNEEEREAAIDGQLRKLLLNCEDPQNEAQQEQAGNEWINSEKCTEAREDLQRVLKPSFRAPDDVIERKQRVVAHYCVD